MERDGGPRPRPRRPRRAAAAGRRDAGLRRRRGARARGRGPHPRHRRGDALAAATLLLAGADAGVGEPRGRAQRAPAGRRWHPPRRGWRAPRCSPRPASTWRRWPTTTPSTPAWAAWPETRAALAAVGVATLGADERADGAAAAASAEVRVVRGLRIAFLAATDRRNATARRADVVRHLAYIPPGELESVLVERVRRARATADVVVVSLHWGTELAPAPSARQRSIARALVAAGAQVVGHHAHVVQPMEVVGDGVVFYSLGNLLFDTRKARHARRRHRARRAHARPGRRAYDGALHGVAGRVGPCRRGARA
ncbi:MAG: CapA family protein [Myxococcota bacterium]